MRKLQKLVDKYESPSEVAARIKDRQTRLQNLVDKHGVGLTATAYGCSEASLQVYLRYKNPTHIREENVIKAETLLSKI